MVDDPANETGNLPTLPDDPGQFILYQTQDGRTCVECRFQNETIWLSQALMVELYQKDVRTINEHLKSIYSDGELVPEATIRKFRIVRREGSREVTRQIEHYDLDAILAVGYRVRSQRGIQFRRWATERLREHLLKGFVLDDDRLKNPPVPGLGVPDYFDEMLERIRDIRASEKRMYLRVREIFAMAASARPRPIRSRRSSMIALRSVGGPSKKRKASRTRSRPLKTRPRTCQNEPRMAKENRSMNRGTPYSMHSRDK